MEDYWKAALVQAAELTGRAAGAGVVPCRITRRDGCCASPAAFARAAELGETPECLAGRWAAQIAVTDSWFDRVTAVGGYLNFHLADQWYAAVVAAPVEPGPVFRAFLPPIPPYPAHIFKKDWRFLCQTSGSVPNPALAARQDGGNPAWLVRYTGRRMQSLAARVHEDCPVAWSPMDRMLLRQAGRYPAKSQQAARVLGRFLTELARFVWRQTGTDPSVAGVCGRALTAGYVQLTQWETG